MKKIIFLFALCTLALSTAFGQQLRGKASYYADRFHGRPTSTGEAYSKDAFTAASKELPVGTIVRVRNVANDKVTQVRINDCGPHRSDRIIDLSKAAAAQIDLLRAGIAVVELEILSLGNEGPPCDRSIYTAANPTPAKQPEKPVVKPNPTPSPAVATPAIPAVANPSPAVRPKAVVEDPNASMPSGDDIVFPLYGVQVAAYGKLGNAIEFIAQNKASYGNLFKRTDTKLIRVFAGPFLSEQAAKDKAAALKATYKIEGIVRRIQ